MQPEENTAQDRHYVLQVPSQRRQRRQSQTLLRGAQQQNKKEQTQAGAWKFRIDSRNPFLNMRLIQYCNSGPALYFWKHSRLDGSFEQPDLISSALIRTLTRWPTNVLSSLQYSNIWDQLSVGTKHLRLRCSCLNLSGGWSLQTKRISKQKKDIVSKLMHISRPLTLKPGSPVGRHLTQGRRKRKPVTV